MAYTVYLLSCADGTLYTGVTTDIERRVAEHNGSAKGAAYTKARRPVKLMYTEEAPSRSVAQKREYELRHVPRIEKLALARAWSKRTK